MGIKYYLKDINLKIPLLEIDNSFNIIQLCNCCLTMNSYINENCFCLIYIPFDILLFDIPIYTYIYLFQSSIFQQYFSFK